MILLLAAALALDLDPGAGPAPAGGGYVVKLDPCEAAAWSDGDEPEMRAWLAAQDSNRLDDYRSFVSLFPRSVCAATANALVAAREQAAARWASGFAHDGVKGPAPAYITGDPSFGITDADYPAVATRAGEEGTVAASYDIAPDGQVENCRVTQSSGSASLDRATCLLITRRARFKPARDADGKPIRSHGSRRLAWRLPHDVPPPQPPSAGH